MVFYLNLPFVSLASADERFIKYVFLTLKNKRPHENTNAAQSRWKWKFEGI